MFSQLNKPAAKNSLSFSHSESAADRVRPGVLIEESYGLIVIGLAFLVRDTRNSQRAGHSLDRFQPVRAS